MLIIPIQSQSHERDAIIIVLGRENVQRLEKSDPLEVKCSETGRVLANPVIMIAYEDETPEFKQVVQSGDLGKIISFLQRGWKFRPDSGDHDRGLENIKEMN